MGQFDLRFTYQGFGRFLSDDIRAPCPVRVSAFWLFVEIVEMGLGKLARTLGFCNVDPVRV